MAIKRGNEVSLKDNVDLSEVSLRLKQDETEKVILISTQDYVQFNAHNSFADKIYPQSCLLVDDNNDECPYCVAYKNGIEALAVKPRLKFAMYVLSTGKIMFWEATASQGKKLIKQIKEYAEDIEFGAIFNFSRTGTGKDTSYGLSLISERKYTDSDKKAIADTKEMEVTDELFEAVCSPKSRKLAIGLLNEMGFPVTQHFADAKAILDEQSEDSTTTATADTSEDEGMPF